MHPATTETTGAHTTHTKGTHAKKGGAGRGIAALLVPLLLLHFLALLALCAAVTNYWINGDVRATNIFGYVAIPILVLLTLIAASVGVATMVMGVIHGKQWNSTARSSSVAANLVTFGLLALAFGFACKALAHGIPGSLIGKLLKAIAALVIIATIVHLIYLFTLGMFKHNDTTTTTNYTTQHDNHYAAPVAAGAAAGYGAGHHHAGSSGYGNNTTTTLGGNNTNLGGGDVRSLEGGHARAGHKNFVGGHEVP